MFFVIFPLVGFGLPGGGFVRRFRRIVLEKNIKIIKLIQNHLIQTWVICVAKLLEKIENHKKPVLINSWGQHISSPESIKTSELQKQKGEKIQ